jgi:cytoskeleton protein RodZ
MNQTTSMEGEQQQGSGPASGPGIHLAAQREAFLWTIEQVASQLNLAPRQIHALETDNYAALPGMAIVRGFIRSYAKLLKIEAEPLLAMIPSGAAAISEPVPTRRTLATPFSSDVRLPLTSARGAPSKATLLALALLLLAGAGLAAYHQGWIAMPASAPPAVREVASVPSATPNVDVPAAVSTVVPDAVNAANVAPDAGMAGPAVAAGNLANAGVPPQSTVVAPVASATPAIPDTVAVATKNALVFKLREDSWLEVRRSNPNNTGASNILISRVVKAGSTETFDVAEPLSIIIGNAAGVEMSLRGNPVDIKADAKTNVARLNLK